MSRNKKRIGHSIAAAHSNDFAALQRQKSCVSVQHFAPVPLFGRARSTSRYRMPPVLPSVGPEATLRTPDFRLPAIRPTFILRPFRTNLSTPKIKKVANECLQPSRPPGRLRREGDSNPGYALDVYELSRRASSTTRAPLLGWAKIMIFPAIDQISLLLIHRPARYFPATVGKRRSRMLQNPGKRHSFPLAPAHSPSGKRPRAL